MRNTVYVWQNAALVKHEAGQARRYPIENSAK
jgi:hypothetical protein